MPEIEILAFGLAAVFGAALARGFFGFGFSALCVASMAWVLPPAMVVPLVFMLEILASIWMLPGVWRDVDFQWLRPVVSGLLIGTPLGVWALSVLPADIARISVYLLVIVLAAGVWQSGRARLRAVRREMPPSVCGVFIGAVNGLATLAGLTAAVFLLSSARSAAGIRASLVALFFISDLYAAILTSGFGLVESAHFKMLALFIAPLIAGLALGGRLFRRFHGGHYRGWALGLILTIALSGLAREFSRSGII